MGYCEDEIRSIARHRAWGSIACVYSTQGARASASRQVERCTARQGRAGPAPAAVQAAGWALSLATGLVKEERVRGGSGGKDFLGVFADLNSGFRIRTDNSGKAPAEQIT